MSYQDRSALVSDSTFTARLNACVANEALGKSGDFADRILLAWGWGGQQFLGSVVSSPGFDRPQEQITDGDLLSAVQANWARVEEAAVL